MRTTFEEFKAKIQKEKELLNLRIYNRILKLKVTEFTLDEIIPNSISINSKNYGKWVTSLAELQLEGKLEKVGYIHGGYSSIEKYKTVTIN